MAAANMEILLKTESKPEAEKVMQLLDGMTNAQKSEMPGFHAGRMLCKQNAGRQETPRRMTGATNQN